MKNKIRWGIAGTGRIAQQFVQGFEFVPKGVIETVSSRSQVLASCGGFRMGQGLIPEQNHPVTKLYLLEICWSC